MSDVKIPEAVWTIADGVWLELANLGETAVSRREAESQIIARAILAERERCARIADEEAEAMAAQRDELLDHGTLGDKPFAADLVKSAAKERRILREGYLAIAQAIRSPHE